jgi:hypothetical protein
VGSVFLQKKSKSLFAVIIDTLEAQVLLLVSTKDTPIIVKATLAKKRPGFVVRRLETMLIVSAPLEAIQEAMMAVTVLLSLTTKADKFVNFRPFVTAVQPPKQKVIASPR